jgi:hypothetical protein
VTIILGVGGEPSNPELMYRIPLETITSIISGTASITAFLISVRTFDASTFVCKKESVGKAYTLEEIRKHYPNAYKPWSVADDELLITLYKGGKSIKELSSTFQRHEGAIQSRIRKLLDTGEQ